MVRKMCVLRFPGERDYELVESWLRPLSPTSALTGDTHEVVTADAVRELNESGKVRYLMVLTDAGAPVGVVNYRTSGTAGSYVIGGAIGDPEKWNGGAGADALGQLVDFLFHELNAHRVEFSTASYNKHTLAILTKGGFVLEGVLRDYYFMDGMYHDRTVWSILRDEFYEGAAAHADQFPVEDLVPEEDKRQAQEALAKYLASDPPTSLTSFGDRIARVRPY